MEIEHVHEHIRYTFSNTGLNVGDKVYPLTMGRCREDGTWVLHEIYWEDYITGFPDDPHTIKRFAYDSNRFKYREIITDKGNGPEMCYYKIIKRERQVKEREKPYAKYIWIEIPEQFEQDNPITWETT